MGRINDLLRKKAEDVIMEGLLLLAGGLILAWLVGCGIAYLVGLFFEGVDGSEW